jgi:hypothetical protein
MLECFAHRMVTREPGVWGHVDETEFHKFSGDYTQTVMARMNRRGAASVHHPCRRAP